MLLNAKFGFYKSCDRDPYLSQLLLGPLQIFWQRDSSLPRLVGKFHKASGRS